MPSTYDLMPAFCKELEKLAFSPTVGNVMGGVGAGAGAGAMVGAGLGAAYGGIKNYHAARQQGGTVGQSLASGVGGALGTAGKGALIGAGAGAVGLGTAAGLGKAPGLASKLTSMGGPIGAGARSGQRQVHALTGWTPEGGIRSIRGGAFDAEKRLVDAQGAGATPGAMKELAGATKGRDAAVKAEQMGLTSLPGYAKALMNKDTGGLVNNAKNVIQTGAAEQWHAGGGVHKALTFGLPAVGIAGELAKPSQEGESGRFERAGHHLGELGMAMGPLPLAGQLVAGGALAAAGKGAGKLVDKVIHKPKPPVQAAPEDTGASAHHEYSDRAQGSFGGNV